MLAAFACGLLFGFGLLISGMTQPSKILDFLDVAGIAKGTWDPSLAVVMVGALTVSALGYYYARQRGQPIFAAQNFWPTRTDIDTPLIAGAVFANVDLGLVIASAMVINMLTAALAGILIPLLLDRFGADPAISSSVFTTMATDCVGFLSFLGLATWWLDLG